MPKVTKEELKQLHDYRNRARQLSSFARYHMDDQASDELFLSSIRTGEEGSKLFVELIHKYIGPDAIVRKYTIKYESGEIVTRDLSEEQFKEEEKNHEKVQKIKERLEQAYG